MDTRNEMRVESVQDDEDKITVTTTGARYIIDRHAQKGKITCYRMLNGERLLAIAEFSCPFSLLTVEKHDDSTCILHAMSRDYGWLRLQVNRDSLLQIDSHRELAINVFGHLRAQYTAQKAGNVLLVDERGGIGLYPYRGLRSAEHANLSQEGWRITFTLNRWSRFLLSVFPPRPFNRRQYLEETISHHGSLGQWDPPPPPFPTDEEIVELSKYARILVLHEMMWQGKYTRKGRPVTSLTDLYDDAPFCSCQYIPVSEKELKRVVNRAHRLGMRVIPYMSPYYSAVKGKDFLAKVDETLARYEMDGVYFDGNSMDIQESYETIRETRALLGDRILYVHCSMDPLGGSIYCPFIDTYADHILRAESGAVQIEPGGFSDIYLRYVISGYDISNAIGHICYYDYPPERIRALVDRALETRARFYLGSPETERERLLKEVYFPRLTSGNPP